MACYDSPVTDEQRPVIWKWARDNVDFSEGLGKVGDKINDHFFEGQAPQKWINDIIGGRKTAFKAQALDVWRKQYDRQTVVRQAQDMNRLAGTNMFGRAAIRAYNVPRQIYTFGHGIVFPITHAGELIFHPTEWARFFKMVGNVYGGTFSKAMTAARLADMARDPRYNESLKAGLEVGPRSHAVGIIGGMKGPAARAWQMLGVGRFEMWKAAMDRWEAKKPGATPAERLDVGKEFASWANDATGAGKGAISDASAAISRKIGVEPLFGPRLTQSKINRVSEIAKTGADLANFKNLSVGERAVAFKRLSGATQYVVTRLGFLAANAAFLQWAGSKDKINFNDPGKSDWLNFKGLGLSTGVPGIIPEVRALSQLLAISYRAYAPTSLKSKLEKISPIFHAKPAFYEKDQTALSVAGQYVQSKLHPAPQIASEFMTGKDYFGRPLPFSQNMGTARKPPLSYPEFGLEHAPIPAQGPAKYVYDQIRGAGASASVAMSIIKGLIITGLGGAGFHTKDENAKH